MAAGEFPVRAVARFLQRNLRPACMKKRAGLMPMSVSIPVHRRFFGAVGLSQTFSKIIQLFSEPCGKPVAELAEVSLDIGDFGLPGIGIDAK